MHKGLAVVGSLMGAFAVALGAFGTHVLKQQLSIDSLATYQTGIQYHFYHVGAVFIAAFLWNKLSRPVIVWAGRLFIIGIFLFSGSLYLMMYLRGFTTTQARWIEAITPIGGVCFILGWLLLGWAVSKGKLDNEKMLYK